MVTGNETESASGLTRGVRGIATLSMLKVNFEAGTDHIDMFLPFVEDAIASISADGFSAADVRNAVEARSGLLLPTAATATILKRAVKRNLVRRDGGRYLKPDGPTVDTGLSARRAEAESSIGRLSKALSEFALCEGEDLGGSAAALDLLIEFLGRYHVDVVLSDASLAGLDESARLPPRLRVVAKFCISALADGDLAGADLRTLVEGYVLQNTLLLSDIQAIRRRFRDLTVYLDSMFLLSALGYTGPERQAAAADGLQVLSEEGIKFRVFADTLGEMRRILGVYESGLSSRDQLVGLRRSDLTRYFVNNRYASSDIRQAIVLLKSDLAKLGIRVAPFPSQSNKYAPDQDKLIRVLLSPGQKKPDGRVMHDVGCAMAVMTMRRGRTTPHLQEANSVFATDSGMVTDCVRKWYRSESSGTIPPVLHIQSLVNMVWLKRPSAETNLVVHELVALCHAALRPTPQTWGKFTSHLRKEVEAGRLADAEMVALVASDLVERRLADVEYERGGDSLNLAEVLDSLREEEEARLALAVEETTRLHGATLETIIEEKDDALAGKQTEVERLSALLDVANSAAGIEVERRRRAELVGSARRGWISRWTANLLCAVVLLVLLAAIILSIPRVFDELPKAYRWAAWTAIGLYALAGFISKIKHVSLRDLHTFTRLRVAKLLRWGAD